MQRRIGTISGFTLFELLLVLALMAIIVSMAAPSFATFGRGRNADYAAARFVALCHWARSQAITDGVIYRIRMDTFNGKWWLDAQKQGAFEDIDMSGLPYQLPEGVTITSDVAAVDGYASIVFDPTGTTTTGQVNISGQQGEPIVIACQKATDFYAIQTTEVRR